MTTEWATRCWGLAIIVGLALPLAHPAAQSQSPPVPPAVEEKPTPGPPAGAKVAASPAAATFETAWSVEITADGPLALTFAPSSLILSGAGTMVQARAFDDGRVLWTAESAAGRAPVMESDLLITTHDHLLTALDVSTGAVRWNVDLGGVAGQPIIAAGRLLLSVGTELRAYRPADGAPLWVRETGSAALTAPTASETAVIVALEDRTLFSASLETGAVVWRERMDVTPVSLLAAGDRIYFGATEGAACAHKQEHGRKDWCFPVRVRPVGSPAVDARYVYFAFLDNMVHVFDRRSGRRNHTPSLGALPTTGPTLAGSYLVVPVVTTEFVLLNMSEGLTLTRVSTPRATEMPSTRAAAVSSDGALLAMVGASPTGRSLVCFRRK